MDTEFLQKLTEEITGNQANLYNMVYFYGDTQSIKSAVDLIVDTYRKHHPCLTIVRTDSISFRAETLEMIKNWDSCASNCDLYIFENIDAVAGSEITEQRLYGIFDRLLEDGRQIIVTGLISTANMSKLAPRVCAQIDGGASFFVE